MASDPLSSLPKESLSSALRSTWSRALSGEVFLDKLKSKVHMANFLRLMQDNQRVLNTSTADDRALRQQRHRFREGQMASQSSQPPGQPLEFPAGDEMGDIRIDSPQTVHHNYPAPPPAQATAPAPKQQMSTLGAVALTAAAIGGLGAAGLGGYMAAKPAAPTPAAVQPTNTTTSTTNREGFLIELVPSK
jgi:hypothetical protein